MGMVAIGGGGADILRTGWRGSETGSSCVADPLR